MLPPSPADAPDHVELPTARTADDESSRHCEGLVVAVDGPSGSGKSTVCREVAGLRGLAYLDTGAMYRALCWYCLEAGIELVDDAAVAAAAHDLDLHLSTDPSAPQVLVGGRDVTADIRRSRVSASVSAVATNLEVRRELIARQRDLIAAASGRSGPGVVAEGRDITTVVAPDAAVRVLVTADEAARLARRAREVRGSSDAAAIAATRDEVVRRDADDSTVASFTLAADGVVTIDNSGPLAETVHAVLALVDAARSGRVLAGCAAAPAGATHAGALHE